MSRIIEQDPLQESNKKEIKEIINRSKNGKAAGKA